MDIEFGKIIEDSKTQRTCRYWYGENIKTVETTLQKSQLSIDVIFQNDNERIYLLNHEAFIYVGIVTKHLYESEFERSTFRGNGCLAGYSRYGATISFSEVLVCELTYNSYKGLHKSVFEDVSRNSGPDEKWIGYPELIRNYPFISKAERITYKACFEHCKNLIPDYRLEKVIEDFQGVPMCVAIYKIEDDDGNVGYASYCFDKVEKAHLYAKKCVKDHLIYCLDFIEDLYKWGRPNVRPQELFVDEKFKEIFKKRTTLNGASIADVKDVYKFIKYALVNVNDNPHPNIEEIDERYDADQTILPANYGPAVLSKKVFDELVKGAYDNYDFFVADDGKTRWKSEYLVYELTKKLYPAQTVYQYRPLFLRSDKGQMSYDVFISGLNIAIEYQGRQHFEPVAFFGGEAAFEENKRRDKLKQELSEKNGIRLIYFRYDEAINEKIIATRIQECLSQ